MDQTVSAFELPEKLNPALAQVLAYWEGLKRGGNEIPFWDDVNLTALPDLATQIALVDVFEGPERFRFGLIGSELADGQPLPVAGKFLDEVSLTRPLEYLRAQSSATVEGRLPTYFECQDAPGLTGAAAKRRLVLPLWGEGQIRMLLVAVA
ncbi:MAG: hypothetical protein ABIO39_09110 [Caulobacteraceae bacterium]